MSERCKHVEKNGFNCGSYAFNLYKDGIDQGNLCDVHYWQAKALAQPEQEPVAWMWDVNNGAGYSSKGIGFYQTDIPFAKHTPLYTAPPQRTWVGLSESDRRLINFQWQDGNGTAPEIIDLVEAKLKEKNT